MKKFFAIMAAALVAFSFASCKGGNEPEKEDYKIEVSEITTKGAHIEVTPEAGVTGTYYWDLIEATEAAKMTDEQVAAYFKEYFDYVIEYYAGYYDLTYADLLLDAADGMDSYDYSGLESNTEYTVVAIALDANIGAAGKSVRKNFKTLEEKEDPVPADMTFEIAVSDITFSSANITVTPSNTTATYYWNIFETAEIAGVSDEELCAAIKENIEYTIEYYAYFGYEIGFEDFLDKGPSSYEFDELEANTAYTVVAFAMGTLGTTNGAVAKYNFSTPELVPESEETLEFSDAIIRDYRDLDGSFMIVAAPADSSVLVALNPFSDEFEGSFTIADLDKDYSGYIDYAEEKQYSIADAEFTGVQNENVVTYTGWFVASNAVKYNFVFNVTLDDTEAAGAPAKKAPVKKDAKIIKKVNLEKTAKRSEKLFNL